MHVRITAGGNRTISGVSFRIGPVVGHAVRGRRRRERGRAGHVVNVRVTTGGNRAIGGVAFGVGPVVSPTRGGGGQRYFSRDSGIRIAVRSDRTVGGVAFRIGPVVARGRRSDRGCAGDFTNMNRSYKRVEFTPSLSWRRICLLSAITCLCPIYTLERHVYAGASRNNSGISSI
jgi:hypothetical protein